MQDSAGSLRRGITTAALLVLALGVAASAQRFLADRAVPLDGPLLYVVAIVLFVAALARDAAPPLFRHAVPFAAERAQSIVAARWRRWLFGASAASAMLAYLFLGRNVACGTNNDYCFTTLNTTLWLVACGTFLVAAWDWGTTRPTVAALRVREWRATWGWTAVALVMIMLVAAWFRFYQLDSVPGEMTSDHVEKLYDVHDVLTGQRPIFFPRNTGREAFQFYWTAALIGLFDLPTTHIALKLGTSLIGLLTIPFVYLLGREVGGRDVGLIAAFLTAVSRWHVAITRVGLRFPFTAAFAIPTLYFVLRGMRLNRRNDWLLAGLFLGVGLHTYTSMRIVPVLVVIVIGLRVLWDVFALPGGPRAAVRRVRAVNWPGPLAQFRSGEVLATDATGSPVFQRGFWMNALMMVLMTVLVFLPLLRYSIERPVTFWGRSLTRASTAEVGQGFDPAQRLMQNLGNALLQFNYKGDNVWVNTVPHDPQLDPVTGALFILGMLYALAAIIGRVRLPGGRVVGLLTGRSFGALAMLVSLFVLLLPSILALAFPIENPSVVRGGGAPPIVMILVAMPMLLAARHLRAALGSWGGPTAAMFIGVLLLASTVVNHRWYFDTYAAQYRRVAWNVNEMAEVGSGFAESIGDLDHFWVVAYPHWVDTRSVFVAMNVLDRHNYLTNAQEARAHVNDPAPKLYLLSPEDSGGMQALQSLYPNGQVKRYQSKVPDRDFFIFFVPGSQRPS